MSNNSFASLVNEIDDLFVQLDGVVSRDNEIISDNSNEVINNNDNDLIFMDSSDEDFTASGKIGNLKSLELRARLGLFDVNEVGFVKKLKKRK